MQRGDCHAHAHLPKGELTETEIRGKCKIEVVQGGRPQRVQKETRKTAFQGIFNAVEFKGSLALSERS